MIRQYLPKTNKIATVAKFKNFSHLNKAGPQGGQFNMSLFAGGIYFVDLL
jgi:hypothetical protein